MELSPLIDKLDDVITNARKVRFSNEVRVNKHETCAIVAQMRGAIPEELKQAHWIAGNRDEMLTEARHETARILEEAREERARMLGREEIEQGAEQRAQRLLDHARARERDIRLGAEEYADDLFARLETYLAKLATGVHRGRERLGGERRGDRDIGRDGDRAGEHGRDRAVEREAALVA